MSRSDRAGVYRRYESGTVCWTNCGVIERSPGRSQGAWRFKGTDIPASELFLALGQGTSTVRFAELKGLDKSAPDALLTFLADQLDEAHDAVWEYDGPQNAAPPALTGGPEHRRKDDGPDTTHWRNCPAASRDARRMSGAWCVYHDRFPVSQVFTCLRGSSVGEFLQNYSLRREKLIPVLLFVADELSGREPDETERREQLDDEEQEGCD